MKIETRDFVLLAYDALGGEIRGKTSLQKKIYFLGVMTDQDLGYGPHYYGPYSPEVAQANSELVALGYVSDSVSGVWGINSRGFEVARHDFRLTDEGRAVAERKRTVYRDEASSIAKAAGALAAGGDLDYMGLSVAAKAYFVLTRQGGKASLEEIRKTAGDFGWPLGDADLDRATGFLENIGLVTRSAAAASEP